MIFPDVENLRISDFTDIQLWSELQSGNPDALKVLFHRYYNDLFFYGKKLCNCDDRIAECLQEVFVNLWEKRKSLSNVQYVKAYIYKIVRNDLLKTNKSRSIFRLFSDSNENEEFGFELSQEDFIVESETSSEQKKLLDKLLEELSAKQREILYLRFYCNMSISEISEAKSINKQSVSNLLNRSLNILREKFNNYNFSILMAAICFLSTTRP